MAAFGWRSVKVTCVEQDTLKPPRRGSVDECSVPARDLETTRKEKYSVKVNDLLRREGDDKSTGMVLITTRG